MQNLTSSIIRSYFAKWSFPYNSKFAKLSKLLMPFSNYINSSIEKCSQIISIKYRNNKLECIDKIYSVPYKDGIKMSSEFISIQKLNGDIETKGVVDILNVGDYESESFQQYPIRGGQFLEVGDNHVEKYDINIYVGQNYVNKTFNKQIRIYSYLEDISNDEVCRVWIIGNDKNGEIISEYINIDRGKIAYESKFKYKTVFKIVSTHKCVMSTYLPLDTVHSSESDILFPKRFVNKNGQFSVPILEIDNHTLSIYDSFSLNKELESSFYIDSEIKKAYITNNMDVLMLSKDGVFYSAKPSPMFDKINDINGSFNDSRYIYVDDCNTKIDDKIVAVFYPHKIASKYTTASVKVSIENNGSVLYVSKDGSLTLDSNTWIPIYEMSDSVKISIECDNENPYIFKIYMDNGEYICAGSYYDYSNYVDILNNVDDIIIFDDEMIIYRDNSIFIFKPSRCIAMKHGDSRLVMDSEYKKLKVEI